LSAWHDAQPRCVHEKSFAALDLHLRRIDCTRSNATKP
jgi:hypothetical protein